MIDYTEILLLQETAKGDAAALRSLYDRFGRRVFRYIIRLVNDHHKAEELTVETFTEVWRSAKNFQGNAQLSTWILGIARNLTMSELRRNRTPLEDLDDTLSCDDDPVEALACEQQSRLIAEALRRLPAIHREVLDLVFMQELNYDQTACIVAVPVNTVKTRVFHAKAKLRKILEEMGIRWDDLF